LHFLKSEVRPVHAARNGLLTYVTGINLQVGDVRKATTARREKEGFNICEVQPFLKTQWLEVGIMG
jgi:hypothetical protein